MARNRMLNPEFWSDEKIGNLSPLARLLFIGTWNFADDEGIFKVRAEFLKSNLFPYDSLITVDQVQLWIDELKKENLIFLYINSGQNYAIILNFKKHQTINKPTPSKLPKPSLQNRDYQKSIFIRDNWTCHICGDYLKDRIVSKDTIENMASIDHLIPKSNNGSDLPINLKTACLHCNKSRGNAPLPEDYYTTTIPLPPEVKLSKDKISKENVADKSASLDFKDIIAYYHTLVLNSEGFKPEIRVKDCALVKSILKRYPKDQVKDIIYHYLSGEKAGKLGIDLSIALSAHSINQYLSKK